MIKYHVAVVLQQGGGVFFYYANSADEALESARKEFPNAKDIKITYPKNDIEWR